MQVFEGEVRLHDTGRLHASSQYILLRGNVVGLRDTIQRVQITAIQTTLY